MKKVLSFLVLTFTFSISNAIPVSKLAEQAQVYADAIGHALYISESDSEWTPFFVDSHVSGFNEKEISDALHATAPVEVYSVESTMDVFEYYHSNDMSDVTDSARYDALLKALQKDFKDFRFIKVGEPDSGSMDLYLIGITEDGQMVGLQTITVET